MTTRSRRGLRAIILVAVAVAAVAVLRPWTIVPSQSTTPRMFDAAAYVDSIWESRVLPAARTSALELQTVLQSAGEARAAAPAPRAVFVKGTATVVEVDRSSRIGLARLRLPSADGAAAIQIGPVLRGTAIRDALDFVRFTDFVNQLEFASVANALNDTVLASVIGPLAVDDLAGRDVTFIGAVSEARGASLEIVPVELQLGSAP